MGDFQLAAMRTFFQGAMGGSFYVFKRKLPRIPPNKWIWTFLCSFCCKYFCSCTHFSVFGCWPVFLIFIDLPYLAVVMFVYFFQLFQ